MQCSSNASLSVFIWRRTWSPPDNAAKVVCVQNAIVHVCQTVSHGKKKTCEAAHVFLPAASITDIFE